MGEVITALVMAAAAVLWQGRGILGGSQRRLKAAWLLTGLVGLGLTVLSAARLSQPMATMAERLLREVTGR